MGPDNDPNVLYSAGQIDLTSAVVVAYKKAFKDKKFDVRKLPRSLPAVEGGRK